MKNLREIRKAKGLTVRACAEAVGATHGQFTRWEGLKCEPSWDKARAIADFLDVSLDQLAGREHEAAV